MSAVASSAAQAQGDGQDANSQHRFEAGLTLLDNGRPREAAVVFSEILSLNPRLVRVRLELGRAYFMSRQWGRARAEFLSVLSGDIPKPVRVNVLGFLRAIDARHGFEWDADVAIATLGNTRDYESDTILLNVGGRLLPFTLDGRDGKTAQGLRFLLSGGYRKDIAPLSGPDMRALGFGRITASGDEGPGSRFDDLTLTGEMGVGFIWQRSSLILAPTISRRFLDGGSFEDRLGLRTTFKRRSRRGTTFALSATYYQIDHLRSETRDGRALIASLSAYQPVTPRLSLGTRLTIEDRAAARSPVDDFRRTRLTVFAAFDMGRGITLRPSLYVERKNVSEPGPTVANEAGTGAALTIESSRIILGNGFTPYVRVEFNRVKSGIPAFSWRDTAVSVGLEHRF